MGAAAPGTTARWNLELEIEVGIMEKNMETTMVEWGILGLYWDNGKENGNYYGRMGYIGVVLG